MNDTLEVSKFIRLLKKYKLTKHQRKTLEDKNKRRSRRGKKKA